MSIPRFSSLLATRKCQTKNTQSESFANITVDVQAYSEEKEKMINKEKETLGIRKRSIFVEESLAWSHWQEASR